MQARIRTILLLEAASHPLELDTAGYEAPPELWRVSSPLQAVRSLARRPADVLILDGELDWPWTFVARLSPERRPAILGVGNAPRRPELADEWLMPGRDAAELSLRLELAARRARERRRTSRRAFLDPLTGLPNRRASVRALLREADRARRSGTHLSLVLLDLDDFKRINEEGGHPAGDRVLKRVGAVLQRLTRTSELCGRIGGDEFALVVAGDEERAQVALDRVLGGLAAAGVAASGASAELRPGENLRELYRRTDRLLYAVKETSRRARAGSAGGLSEPIHAS